MDQKPTKKEEFSQCKAKFSNKVTGENLEILKFIKSGMFEYVKTKQNDLDITSKQTLTSKGIIIDKNNFTSLNSKLQEFKKENETAKLFEKLSFNSTLKKGDQFSSINNLKCVLEDKTEALEHKQGMVYLIDFWATWCGPCQRPMVIITYFQKHVFQQHNQEMLEKNAEKWKDKVEIFGVSLDENIEDIKKRVETKNWKLIHHYQNPEEDNLSIFDIDGIPTIYIIDQKGNVAYVGHPMTINVEEFIDKLIEKGPEDKPKTESLTKEQFKKMKTNIDEFLKKALTKEDKFMLKIVFAKKKVFDFKWNVLEKKYNYPKLSYETKIKHNEKLQNILHELFQKYPKTQFKIVKEQVIDTNSSTQNCIKYATSELLAKELTVHQNLDLVQSKKLKFMNRNKSGLLSKKQKLQFSSEKPFPPSQAEKVTQFNESIQKYKQQAKFKEDVQILNSFVAQAKIAKGDEFCPVKGQKVRMPEPVEEKPEEELEKKEPPIEIPKEIVTIEHIPGEVLMVDFWATWCPPCQGPMQHNQDMLTKHKDDWGKKVRIVAASVDQGEEAVQERAKQKGWMDIEHIILNSEEFQQAPRLYGVRGIPFIVLVNKQGKIDYMGHPASIKVEEELQKLLDEEIKEEEHKQEEEKPQKGVITEQQFKNLLEIQKEYLQIFREKVKDEEFGPTIVLKLAKNVKYNLEGNIIGQPTYIARKLQIKMYEKQYIKIKEFEQFLDKINSIVKKEEFETEFKFELDKCIDIDFGKECNNCKKELIPTDKQYYCHFHKLWFCYDCGNKIDETKKGNQKYIHPCNMVYIHVINDSCMKNIDEYKFGTNIQFEENDCVHSYSCNGCGSCGVERYVCLSCRPGPMRPGGFVDLCEHCVKVLDERDLESEKYKTVRASAYNDEKHDEQTHIMLRILFGKGNYYKY